MTAGLRRVGDHAARETGSATVWALVLAMVVGSAGTVLTALASVAVAGYRAGAAADLAALAAAGRSADESGACVLARRVAEAQGGRLRACVVRSDVADVTVEVALSGSLGRLPPARVRARAGPTDAVPRLRPAQKAPGE